MKVDGHLVAELRKRNSWSQDELALASDLNLRTIQRIENVGSASLQSIKSIAAALQIEVEDLEGSSMPQYEYKTVALPFRVGIFKHGLPDIQETLNAHGVEGWRFKQMIMPSSNWGTSDSMIAILEKPID